MSETDHELLKSLPDWIEAVNGLEDSPANDAFKEALTELLSHVLKVQISI